MHGWRRRLSHHDSSFDRNTSLLLHRSFSSSRLLQLGSAVSRRASPTTRLRLGNLPSVLVPSSSSQHRLLSPPVPDANRTTKSGSFATSIMVRHYYPRGLLPPVLLTCSWLHQRSAMVAAWTSLQPGGWAVMGSSVGVSDIRGRSVASRVPPMIPQRPTAVRARRWQATSGGGRDAVTGDEAAAPPEDRSTTTASMSATSAADASIAFADLLVNGLAHSHSAPSSASGATATNPSTAPSDRHGGHRDGTAAAPLQGDQPSSRTRMPAPQSPDVSSLLAIDPADIHIVAISDDNEANPSTPNGRNSANGAQSSSSSSPTNSAAAGALLRQLPFVSMFRGSANYIANHRGTTAVYHIPGGLLDLPDPTVFRDLMNDVALTWLLGMKIVLVVGCRHQIERRIAARNAEESNADDARTDDPSDRFHGLRVTDEDTLRIVKEEAGYVRFEVERQLARSLRVQGASGGNSGGGGGASTNGAGSGGATGSEGAAGSAASAASGYYDGNVVSGNFYSAQPFGILDGVDYKYTGFVRRVEVEKIRKLHDSRDICLLTTLGVSPSGEVFNVNSESLASCVAGALQASKVIFFTEQEMELRHSHSGNKIQSLRLSDARNLLKYADLTVHPKGYVTLGPGVSEREFDRPALHVLLKIGYSIQALEQGVKRAHIISPKHGALLQELYTRDGSGTLVSGDLYEGIRRAAVNDVAGIYELISPLIKMGTLIDRPKAVLEKDIDTYYVYTRDNHIVACGQLKKFEDGFAEIGCLVVNKEYRSRGRGDAMLGYLERLCVLSGCSTVFVLSTQTMEWFVERGFEEVGVEQLPLSRQQTYNYARRSKIYLKKIESVRDLDASELWWNR